MAIREDSWFSERFGHPVFTVDGHRGARRRTRAGQERGDLPGASRRADVSRLAAPGGRGDARGQRDGDARPPTRARPSPRLTSRFGKPIPGATRRCSTWPRGASASRAFTSTPQYPRPWPTGSSETGSRATSAALRGRRAAGRRARRRAQSASSAGCRGRTAGGGCASSTSSAWPPKPAERGSGERSCAPSTSARRDAATPSRSARRLANTPATAFYERLGYVAARAAYDLHMHVAMRIGSFDTDERVLVVAEIGNNHEGDAEVARELVRAAAEAGAHAVKFQTFRAGRHRARARRRPLRAALRLRARAGGRPRARGAGALARAALHVDAAGPGQRRAARAAGRRLQDRLRRQRLPAAARARGRLGQAGDRLDRPR